MADHAYFIDSGGNTVRVPLAEAGEKSQLGWVPASQKQVDDLHLQEQYGGGGQQIAAGAEAAADALTFGLSSHVERAFGATKEGIKGRAEADPNAHGAGAVIGTVGPMLVGDEAGALGAVGEGAEAAGAGTLALKTAASISAPSLITKAGKGVAGVVESALPEATSTLGKLAVKGLSHAAGGAAEGALWSGGHVVHEAALGDPNLTAQSAISEIGLGTLLGGGIGGTLGTLGELAKMAPGAGTTKLGDKLSGWLEDFEGDRNIKATGANASDIKQALKGMSKEDLNSVSLDARKMGLVDTFTTPSSALEKSGEAMDASGQKMGGMLDAADASGATPKPIEDITARIRKEVLEPLEESTSSHNEAAASSVKKSLAKYEERFASMGDESVGFRGLHDLRMDLDTEARGFKGLLDPTSSATKSAYNDMRRIVSDEISKGIDDAGLDSAAWKAANREYRVAATINKFADAAQTRAHGNNMVSPTELLSGAAGLVHGGPLGAAVMGAATGVARRFASGALGTAAKGIRGFLDSGAAEQLAGKTSEAISAARQAGQDTLTAAATSAPESVAAMSVLQAANNRVTSKISKAAEALIKGDAVSIHPVIAGAAAAAHASFESRAAQITSLAATPETMLNGLQQSSADIHEHAPQTSQALQTAQTRVIQSLSQSMPKPVKTGPLGPTIKPSKTDIAKWNVKYDVAQHPLSVLDKASKGTLTPDAVAFLKASYPALHAHMAESLMSAAASHRGAVPYRNKAMLSMLVGQPLDGTLSGKSIAANQLAYALPSKKEDAGGGRARTSQTGLGKLNLGGAMRLPGSAAESRMRGSKY